MARIETNEKMSSDEKYYRQPWMSDDQWECACLLANIQGGFHHVSGKIKSCGAGIETSIYGSWATFDFNLLTVAVVLAHDRMIRFEVASSGPGMFRVIFHKRHTREGRITQRHPTMEEALNNIRAKFPAEEKRMGLLSF